MPTLTLVRSSDADRDPPQDPAPIPLTRPLGVVSGRHDFPSRGVRRGWRFAHLDLVAPDGPEDAA